jgi:hypothetical protein
MGQLSMRDMLVTHMGCVSPACQQASSLSGSMSFVTDCGSRPG